MFLHDRFRTKLNAVARLNREKCAGNTTNAQPIKHIWDLGEKYEKMGLLMEDVERQSMPMLVGVKTQ